MGLPGDLLLSWFIDKTSFGFFIALALISNGTVVSRIRSAARRGPALESGNGFNEAIASPKAFAFHSFPRRENEAIRLMPVPLGKRKKVAFKIRALWTCLSGADA